MLAYETEHWTGTEAMKIEYFVEPYYPKTVCALGDENMVVLRCKVTVDGKVQQSSERASTEFLRGAHLKALKRDLAHRALFNIVTNVAEKAVVIWSEQ